MNLKEQTNETYGVSYQLQNTETEIILGNKLIEMSLFALAKYDKLIRDEGSKDNYFIESLPICYSQNYQDFKGVVENFNMLFKLMEQIQCKKLKEKKEGIDGFNHLPF
jgi:hypothetical protein